MAVALFSRQIAISLKQRFFQQCRTGYIVLLPEVNPDIPDQNPLFKHGLPNIEQITPEKCVDTLGKHIIDFEHCVREVEEELIAPSTEDNAEVKKDLFDRVVDPLETLGAPMEATWGLVKTMYLANNEVMPGENYLSLHDRARRARSMKYNSHHIYSAFKNCDSAKLTEEEQRIVSKFLTEGKLNGMELEGEKKELFTATSGKLAMEKEHFRSRVEVGKRLFRHIVIDPDVLKVLPERLLKAMSPTGEPEKGPWAVTLSPNVFPLFMEYCPDRDLRWNAWLASRQVCSAYSENELRNGITLEQIRLYRRDQAEILGYRHFFDMSMETKMAGSVESVQQMLLQLLEKARKLQKVELESLKDFAEQHGFEHQLNMWDIAYWAREQKKAIFDWDDHEVKEYFPLETVFEGLINLCNELFCLRIEPAPDVPTWHPDVKFYNIFEGEAPKPVAGFYFDPYMRHEKLVAPENTGFMIGIRTSARVFGPLTPLAALIFNFTPPTKDRPSLLSFPAVDTLFRKFGSALQQLLSTVNYSEVSGSSNIEWDSVETVSNIMSLWLNDPKVLNSISKHYKTGEKLPVTNMEAIRRHMAGFNLCSELYLANLDLQLHTSKDFWMSIMKEQWPQHFLIPLDRGDMHPCSFVECIAGEYSAAYYSRIWSRMLASDAFTSFVDSQDRQSVGIRFRDTFLAFGGSCHPSEVFRRFQGRDPTPEAFLESLEKDKSTPIHPTPQVPPATSS